MRPGRGRRTQRTLRTPSFAPFQSMNPRPFGGRVAALARIESTSPAPGKATRWGGMNPLRTRGRRNRVMNDLDLASLMSRSSLFDPAAIDWDAVPHHPLPPAALRTLLYMQDIESHTVIYLRELLSTRAVDDPQMAGFFATWFYEETAHARALGRFLAAAGHAVTPRPRSTRRLGEWIEAVGISCLAAAWRDFIAVHMTWGAIN